MSNLKKSAKLKDSDDNEFGKFLYEAREKKGLTLAEVAGKLGLNSPQPVWDWENNKGAGIPAEMLLRLVRIYGISTSDAYEQLMKFHQRRTQDKIHDKFEQAKLKVMGGKK